MVMTRERIEPGNFGIQVYSITITTTFLQVTSAQGLDSGSHAVWPILLIGYQLITQCNHVMVVSSANRLYTDDVSNTP
jgi:hypothetical protein